jgi:hypothetical protein
LQTEVFSLAITTTTARLEQVQAAIAACESGQSFTLDGVTYTRPTLATLYKQEQYLSSQLAKENGARPFMKTIGFGGMSY